MIADSEGTTSDHDITQRDTYRYSVLEVLVQELEVLVMCPSTKIQAHVARHASSMPHRTTRHILIFRKYLRSLRTTRQRKHIRPKMVTFHSTLRSAFLNRSRSTDLSRGHVQIAIRVCRSIQVRKPHGKSCHDHGAIRHYSNTK